MIRKIEITGLQCLCSVAENNNRVAFILYPLDMLSDWIEAASKRYNVTIVVVTGMDWQNVFSPWPAKGVPDGSPDFKGEAPEFLKVLQQRIIPQVETIFGLESDIERTLVGVSMSGLFALWQWILCDTFQNISSLSGSFWYDGFIDWLRYRTIPAKSGKAFFLLGNQEAHSKVKVFNAVEQNTQDIVSLLHTVDIGVKFESVPGNHYSNPIPRLEAAFSALYTHPESFRSGF